MAALLQIVRDAPDLWTYYGGVLVLLQRWEDAEEAYVEALQLEATNVAAHLGLGMMFAEKGDLQQAKAWFEKTLELYPDNDLAQDALWDLKQTGTLS